MVLSNRFANRFGHVARIMPMRVWLPSRQ